MTDPANPPAGAPPAGAPPANDPPAAGAAGQPPAAGAATPPAAGQATGDGSPPAAPSGGSYRPDGLPDHLAGATERETIDKLYKAFDGYRTRAGQLEAPPKDAAGYDFQWSDKAKPYLGEIGDDKFVAGLREVALKAGLNNGQATGFLNGAIELMLDLDLVDKPVDTAAELAKLTPAEARSLPPAEQEQARQKRLSANLAYVDGLARDGLDPAVVQVLKAELTGFPELHQLLEHVRGPGVQPSLGGTPPGAPSVTDLQARMADPRQQFGNPKYDPAFAAETTRLYKLVHGEGEGRR